MNSRYDQLIEGMRKKGYGRISSIGWLIVAVVVGAVLPYFLGTERPAAGKATLGGDVPSFRPAVPTAK